MPPQRESTKCPLACEYCRVVGYFLVVIVQSVILIRGLESPGAHTSQDHHEPCVFPEKRKRTRKRKEREIDMEDRLARMEELLRASAAQNSISESQSSGRINSPDLSQEPWMRNTEQSVQNNCNGGTAGQTPPQLTPSAQEVSSATIVASPYPAMSLIFPDETDYSQPLDQDTITIDASCSQMPAVQTTNTICAASNFRVPVSPPSTTAAEHTASIEAGVTYASPLTFSARTRLRTKVSSSEFIYDKQQNWNSPKVDFIPECASYLSICTFPAIKWVSSQAGMSDFLVSARRLSKTVMQGESLGQVVGSARTAEPSYQVAMEWSKAYFDSCLDSIFGIIHREDFENRLRDHFQTNPDSRSDASWYALRNTIYASGCRVSLCADSGPESFSRSREQSWKYFENALSVHTELLYVSTDIMSIQALILMAFHAEALGTPALEFMLVSSATRLAQAKGLHMRYSRSSKDNQTDTLSKQCLWWIIYAYEKHLAYRSGLPSAIDDDSMTCLVPTELRLGSGTTMEFVKQTISLARLSSSITKRLSAVKAMTDPPDVLLTTVHDLDQKLKMWREGLDPTFQKQPPFRTHCMPQSTQVAHMLYLHYSYHALLIAVHGVFCYPWNRPDLQNNEKPEIKAQVQRSTEAVAESSRQIIIAVQHVEITAALPVWLTFYFPLVGLINMFVCVLKNPLNPSTMSNLALMDIVVGHFGYVEFLSSSKLDLSFPREVASYARNLVKNVREENDHSNSTSQSLNVQSSVPAQDPIGTVDMSVFDPVLGLEDWCTFLPSIPSLDIFEEPFLGDRG
ncbi:unnamed protein product [Clonostachys solani]|uniref:Xylanolytic transcriptional activator regulatory domain-containing protein n=1 Tax=Clonostachys solani TaxID=160281 RepID=A0A9N9Z062_9HYPO|nr:unnamed protein product [Clonostachys solani]